MADPPDKSNDVLSYQDRPAARPRPSPLAASLLCLPGAFCWCVLGIACLDEFGPRWLKAYARLAVSALGLSGAVALVLPMWGVAVITAIASVILYVRKPKPWYVVVNLAINVAGLLLTLGVLITALMFSRIFH